MSYKSETIQAIIPRLNKTFFLPSMQREFVWSADQICTLFDSLMRRYPISAFLVWKVSADIRNDLEIYEFLGAVKATSNRASMASVDGDRDVFLVIDGQQRLTALLVGLNGIYHDRIFGKVKNSSHSEDKKLHLNLLHDGRRPTKDDKLEYEFRFISHSKSTSQTRYWFPVGDILNRKPEGGITSLIEREIISINRRLDHPLRSDAVKIVEHNLVRLYDAIWTDETISYHIESDPDDERILEIFIRANSGGTKLSKSDLLLSTLILHWGDDNAKDIFNDFVDSLNAVLTRGGQKTAASKNRLTTDFVMKSCLVLLKFDGPVAYQVGSFNKDMCRQIRAGWDDISDAIRRSVEAASAFGIDGKSLTSANALIPIAYYLKQNPRITLLGESEGEVANAKRVRIWLLSALMNHVLSGSSDGMLEKLRAVINLENYSHHFPTIFQFDQEIRKAHRTATSSQEAINNVLGSKYKDDTNFLALSLLYDDRHWDSNQYSVDHLFPQSELRSNQWDVSRKDRDDFANLVLIRARENSERGNQPLSDWLATRSREFITRHFIPADKTLWHADKYQDFLIARRRLLRARLAEIFSVDVDAI